jgi:hypothetical protein
MELKNTQKSLQTKRNLGQSYQLNQYWNNKEGEGEKKMKA